MADDRTDRGDGPLDEGKAGGRGGRLGRWLRLLVGDEGDRKARLIGLVGVAVVLLILLGYAAINQRATERRNLATITDTVEQATPTVHVSVLRQEVAEGAAVTHLRWTEVDPSGAQGDAEELTVVGGVARIDVHQADVQHRRWEQPATLSWFAAVATPNAETTSVIDDRGPDYYDYRGERRASVQRTTRKLWRWLLGAKPAPKRVTVVTRELASFELPLLVGEQWELTLGPTGAVDARRLRSPRDDHARFELSRPVQTTNGLEVVVEEAVRQVEFAEQLDDELVFVRVRVRLHNGSERNLTIDPNLFQLQDDRQQVFRPARSSVVTLAAGTGQTLRQRFLVPPTSSGLRFTIPGETVAGGDDSQPVALFLQREQAYLGDVRAAGGLLMSLDQVDLDVAGDQFELVAALSVVNLSWESRKMRPEQFTLSNVGFERDRTIKAREISLIDLDPYLPEQVMVTFELGDELERVDLRLDVAALERKGHGARFELMPLDDGVDATAGRTYLRELCGARHYQRFGELKFGGPRGVLGLLSDRKAREQQAQHHLQLAGSYYPESVLIRRASGEPETP